MDKEKLWGEEINREHVQMTQKSSRTTRDLEEHKKLWVQRWSPVKREKREEESETPWQECKPGVELDSLTVQVRTVITKTTVSIFI